MVEAVRILLVGDDALALEGLSHLLTDALVSADIETTPAELVTHDGADVVVWDWKAVSEWEPSLPLDIPIVVLTSDPGDARRALAAGARGVVRRDASAERIARAIEAAIHDLVVIDTELAGDVLRAPSASLPSMEALTPREMEVLQELSLGQSNKEIAARLGISPHTAKFHVTSLMAKLGAATRTEVVALAARAGLVSF